MTLSEFVAVLDHRIPTAPEFVAFARAQGWRFDVTAERAVLYANGRDPFVLGFAKMLSREPYRTRVLEHLEAVQGREPVPAGAAREPESAPDDPEGERVRNP